MRIAAFLIDLGGGAALVLILGNLFGLVAGVVGSWASLVLMIDWGVCWVLLVTLMLIRDALPGGSPGRRLVGLRVRAAGGKPPSISQSIKRNLPLLIPFGVFYEDHRLRSDPDGRRAGDRWAGTRVEEL